MRRIDYKIFVPREVGINYIDVNNKEYLVDEILSANIFFSDDKVIYYFYLTIEETLGEMAYNPFDKPRFKGKLLIDNVAYFMEGEGEIISKMKNMQTFSHEYKIIFTVNNASKTINNLRNEVKVSRTDLIDLED